nr:tumor necrosis factor receptor superfamily member 10B-like [Microcebus murinus]
MEPASGDSHPMTERQVFPTQVLADSATTKQDGVPQLTPAPQRWRHSPEDGLCPPGTFYDPFSSSPASTSFQALPPELLVCYCRDLSDAFGESSTVYGRWKYIACCPRASTGGKRTHMSEDSRDCPSCIYGVDYTTHRNALPSCLLCSICNSDEEESSPCTMTANRECQCKAGTFRGEDSPEFCQKCRTRCPDGMVENRTCTPWSDLVCVPKGSGTKTSGEAPSPRGSVTTSSDNSTSPFSSSGSGLQPGKSEAIVIVVGVLVLSLVLIGLSCWCTCTGCCKALKRKFSCYGRSPGGAEDEDNSCNEILSNRDSCSTMDSQQTMECQEPEVLAGVIVTSPGKSEGLLVQGEDGASAVLTQGKVEP